MPPFRRWPAVAERPNVPEISCRTAVHYLATNRNRCRRSVSCISMLGGTSNPPCKVASSEDRLLRLPEAAVEANSRADRNNFPASRALRCDRTRSSIKAAVAGIDHLH